MSGGHFDLIVVGGGPGGSTLATLVAQQGHRVLLLERQRFPRHTIGESLLPSTVHGICRLLGVSEELQRAGFPRKRGGTFLWGKSPTPWTFAFSKHPQSPVSYAFQVERSRFDKILLDNAARAGVVVKQETAATEMLKEGDRVVGLRYRDATGLHGVGAAFVADAAGHQSPFHRLVGHRLFSKFFQNIALYAYFRRGKRLPPPNSGNILCAAFPTGWFWYIPLSDDLTSVGVVVSKTNADTIQQGREQAFRHYVSQCPLIAEYLRDASRVTEGMYGEFRIRSDYSYCNTSFYRDGLILVGDAACFVDPVLSSGVHLATYGALLAARSVNTCLAGRATPDSPGPAECFAEFEQRYRREYGKFYEFLASFYDMHRDESSYFWKARKVVRGTGNADDEFVRLVAGLSERDEPLFAGDGVLADPEHGGLGEWFETHAAAPDDRSGDTPGVELQAFDFDSFMPGLSTEMTQIQTQALLGRRRPAETPLEAQGLVPSADGLHWLRAVPCAGGVV